MDLRISLGPAAASAASRPDRRLEDTVAVGAAALARRPRRRQAPRSAQGSRGPVSSHCLLSCPVPEGAGNCRSASSRMRCSISFAGLGLGGLGVELRSQQPHWPGRSPPPPNARPPPPAAPRASASSRSRSAASSCWAKILEVRPGSRDWPKPRSPGSAHGLRIPASPSIKPGVSL